jgi:hypothetical protein
MVFTIPYWFAICKASGRIVPVLGGDEGARTPDLDSAIVALSQLSYIPNVAYNSILVMGCKGLLFERSEKPCTEKCVGVFVLALSLIHYLIS